MLLIDNIKMCYEIDLQWLGKFIHSTNVWYNGTQIYKRTIIS